MKVYNVKVNGKTYRVELQSVEEVKGAPAAAAAPTETKPAAVPTGDGQPVLSPIQGKVVNVVVKVGDKVKKGDKVCVVEAMKLENDVVSDFEGEVVEILVSKGATVAAKAPLIIVK